MRFLKVILSIAIICSAYVGDYVVFRSKYSSSQTFRAIADCSVHATLGFLSSTIFFSHEHSLSIEICIINVLICTFVSLLIDIDHAFVARSIYLKVSCFFLIYCFFNTGFIPKMAALSISNIQQFRNKNAIPLYYNCPRH